MKVQIVRAERVVTIESKLTEVDLQEFMREHFPRKHNWEDEAVAMAYLQKQMNGPYLQSWADENCELPGHDRSWVESIQYWASRKGE